MIEAVQGRLDGNGLVADWLTCFYLTRLFECGLMGDEPPHPPDLEYVLKCVPASPEKYKVVDTLERHLHD